MDKKKNRNKIDEGEWSSESNSGDDNLVFNDECSDDDGCIFEDLFETYYFKTERKDDFPLVKFPNNVFYVGKLLSDMDVDNDYEISYIRKSEKLCGCFVFPNIPDFHSVNRTDIEFILPEPTNIKSKRLLASVV